MLRASMIRFNRFKIEHYHSHNEFKNKYILSCSDAESWSLDEVLSMADARQLNMWENQRFSDTEIKGLYHLRETIAQSLYQGFTADNILCFAGGQEGIFCTLLTLCTPQDHVITLVPCYQSLAEVPRATGCDLTILHLREEHKWGLDIQEIKASIQANTKAVIINFPHNPTGQLISESQLKELIDLLRPRGIWLFSDEVYRLLGPAGTQWASPASILYEKAISLGVMSKSFGMAGLRVGWIACQDKHMLERIENTKYYTSICNSGPAEILSIIAISHKDHILNRNNSIVEKNLFILDDFIKNYERNFSWVHPKAGCTAFIKYHHEEGVEALCERLQKKAEVLLLPGAVFDIPDHFRLGFGRKNMEQILGLIEKTLFK